MRKKIQGLAGPPPWLKWLGEARQWQQVSRLPAPFRFFLLEKKDLHSTRAEVAWGSAAIEVAAVVGSQSAVILAGGCRPGVFDSRIERTEAEVPPFL